MRGACRPSWRIRLGLLDVRDEGDRLAPIGITFAASHSCQFGPGSAPRTAWAILVPSLSARQEPDVFGGGGGGGGDRGSKVS